MKLFDENGHTIGHTSIKVNILGIENRSRLYYSYVADCVPRIGEKIKIRDLYLEVVDVLWKVNNNKITANVYIYDHAI